MSVYSSSLSSLLECPDAVIGDNSAALAEERSALTSLFDACGGKDWNRRDGWGVDGTSVSSWYGVDTNEQGSIVAIDLADNVVIGDIYHVAVAAALLPNLAELFLSNNFLTGKLPESLAAHPILTVLDISSNLLYGTLGNGFIEPHDFRYLVTSDNQLSMFSHCAEAAPVVGDATIPTTAFVVDSGEHPLAKIYLSEGTLTAETCSEFIRLAEEAAVARGGWQTKRHRKYATTDMDCGKDASLRALCNLVLESRIMPLIARLFGVELPTVLADDVFVVKYDATQQASLGEHRDGSDISFIVLLNDPHGFEGGGTAFAEVEPCLVVAPRQAGDCVAFCGRQLHAGATVTQGIRYILAGFLRVFDERATSEAAAGLFCACDGESCAAKRRNLGQGSWAEWGGVGSGKGAELPPPL